MKNCSEKRFENMRGPWELDLLEESERLEFELHLYDCESCRQSLIQSEKAARVLRHADAVRESVAKAVASEQTRPSRAIPVQQRIGRSWKRWSLAVPASLVAAVVFLNLVFKPWQIDIRSTDEAIAAEDRLVILYFANITDPPDAERLGDIATNLLITDIGESQHLRVTSGERLLNIAMNLGYDKAESRQPDLSFEVARKARARWMLTGEILRIEPELAITSRLVEVATGDVIATQRVIGEIGEDIFSVIDKVSAAVKQDLPLPATAREEPSRSVAEITTHSPEAYRHYLNGVEYKTRFYTAEAIDQFELALEYDSTFAMAYYHLAVLKDRNLIHQARAFSQHTSRREKSYINTSYALISGDTAEAMIILQELIKDYPDDAYALWRLGRIYVVQGRNKMAIPYFEAATRIDPSYRDAYNSLAYAYDDAGNWEQSIRAIDRYLEIAPEEANPYDTRGDLYARRGKLDMAIESYRKALSIKPDFYASLQKLSQQYLLKGDFKRADSCYRVLSQSGDIRSRSSARHTLASLVLRQGQFSRAVHLLDTLISGDSSDAQYHGALAMLLMKSRALVRMNQYDSAGAALDKCREIVALSPQSMTVGFHSHFIEGLAGAGRIDEARNELKLLESISKQSDGVQAHCWQARGYVAFWDGDLASSLRAFEQANQLSPSPVFQYMIARTFLESQKLDEAAELFEALISDASSRSVSAEIRHVEIYYFLGRTYEQLQEFSRAIDQYDMFLSLWRDADTDLPVLTDARERVERLKQSL